MKIKKLICLIMVIITVLGCSGCGCVNFKIPSFKEMCKTSADGFVYYVDRSIGLCIIELPKTEEVVIPEYIDGIRVAQLGYDYVGLTYGSGGKYCVDGSHVKKLTIQHPMVYYSADFSYLEVLCVTAIVYAKNMIKAGVLIDGISVDNGFYLEGGKKDSCLLQNVKEVYIYKDITNQDIIYDEKIYLWEDIKYIEKDSFKNYITTFETSYSEKPSGWEEGWNGNNPVVWNSKVFGE